MALVTGSSVADPARALSAAFLTRSVNFLSRQAIAASTNTMTYPPASAMNMAAPADPMATEPASPMMVSGLRPVAAR